MTNNKYRGNRRMPIDQTERWDRLGCWAAPRLSTYALSISKDPVKRCGYDDFGTLFDLFWPCNFFKAALRSWFAAFCWGWCPFFEFCTAKFRYLTASCHAATPKGTHWVPIQTPWFVHSKRLSCSRKAIQLQRLTKNAHSNSSERLLLNTQSASKIIKVQQTSWWCTSCTRPCHRFEWAQRNLAVLNH